MKYHKFEKIVYGKNPIIRVTFKTWYGKLIVRDICKSETKFMENQFWIFMDNGSLTHNFEPINIFDKLGHHVYWINGKKLW